MDRSAIFVDAGYLFAAAGQLVCGTRSRAQLDCDARALTSDLAAWVHGHSGGLDSLRTYWYDGAANAVPTAQHEQIGGFSYVKVRLGRLIQGEQKGVDALIYRDLMTLARERAIARAYVLSGDEDLREGVVAAQDMGVQVVLLGIPTSQRTNQSAALIREADEHVVLSKEHWARFFAPRATSAPQQNASPAEAQAAGRAFAVDWISKAKGADLADLHGQRPKIPREIDVPLLLEAEKPLGSLRERQDLKREVRAGFWSAVDDAVRATATGNAGRERLSDGGSAS
jgi:hypothetical protein